MPDCIDVSGQKFCRYCAQSLPLTSFCVRRKSPDGLTYKCRQCDNRASKQRRQEKPEETRAGKAKCYQAKRDQYYQKSRGWIAGNKARRREIAQSYIERNRDEHARRMKDWQKRNPAKLRAISNKRHCAKLFRTPNWLTPGQLSEIERFYQIAVAAELIFGTPFDVDHIVPLQGRNVSGLHVPWNLQVLPARINRSKSNRHESDD